MLTCILSVLCLYTCYLFCIFYIYIYTSRHGYRITIYSYHIYGILDPVYVIQDIPVGCRFYFCGGRQFPNRATVARLTVPHSHTQSPSYMQSMEHAQDLRGTRIGCIEIEFKSTVKCLLELASNSKIHISAWLVLNYTSYSSVYFGLELALYTLEVASLFCFLLSVAMIQEI